MTAPTTVILERLRIGAQSALSPSMAHSADFDAIVDPFTGALVARITAAVHAQRIADGTVTVAKEIVHDWPATTWQMFKGRHADSWWLAWLVRRRPVVKTCQRREVELTATWVGHAMFPDSTIVIDDNRLGAPIYRLTRNESTAVRDLGPGAS